MKFNLLENSSEVPSQEMGKVSVFPISQATTATFSDLYFRLTFFFFIQKGSKRVLFSNQDEIIGEEGDLMIFPPGSVVTMENRPVLHDDYRASGVCFSHDLIETVYSDINTSKMVTGIQIVRANNLIDIDLLALIQETLNSSLPEPILRHRLLEPLVWLREQGIFLPSKIQDQPISKVRQFIEQDLSHAWRMEEVAKHFSMSEATMRRLLSKNGQGFAKLLLHSRLEQGLTLLQTTDLQITQIATECGFKTPSHFSDTFRKRFGITPKDIRLRTN